MDVIEVPSHFMENFVNDARTLPLFMSDARPQSQDAAAIAQQVLHDRHMFGALDLETQASSHAMDLRCAEETLVPYHLFLCWVGELLTTYLFAKNACSKSNHTGRVQPVWRQAAGQVNNLQTLPGSNICLRAIPPVIHDCLASCLRALKYHQLDRRLQA